MSNLGVLSSSSRYLTLDDYITKNPIDPNCTKTEFFNHIEKCKSANDFPASNVSRLQRIKRKSEAWDKWKKSNSHNVIKVPLLNTLCADGLYFISDNTSLTVSNAHPHMTLITELLANPTVSASHIIKSLKSVQNVEKKAKKQRLEKNITSDNCDDSERGHVFSDESSDSDD